MDKGKFILINIEKGVRRCMGEAEILSVWVRILVKIRL